MNAHMIIDDIRTLPERLSERSALMALDLGDKTIGMAVSDDERRVASALDTIRRTKFTEDAQSLLQITQDYGIGGFILGLPVNMDGTEGPRCQSARRLRVTSWAIRCRSTAWVDMRSSQNAIGRSVFSDRFVPNCRAEVVDKLAAQFILQGALDFLRNLTD